MSEPDLARLLVTIAQHDHDAVADLLRAAPSLAVTGLARPGEFFLAERRVQVYAGDTALHAAAFSYDAAMASVLLDHGADVRAQNRRGAQPLHAATAGAPGSDTWDPDRQRQVIRVLVESGADPNARASGGVTALHRAARNRCSAAVETLLRAGADPGIRNDRGSTAWDIAQRTTGRGGTGSPEARAEQRIILDLLAPSSA